MSHALFDAIRAEKNLTSDHQVGKLLGYTRNTIAVLRNGNGGRKVGPEIILSIYDATGWSIERIRELAADTTTPRAPVVRAKKPATKPWHAVASKRARPAAPAVVAPVVPAVPSNITITKAPQWVSRVHRIM